MSGILEDALREYNETYATMDLVLFEDAMKHVRNGPLRLYIVRLCLHYSTHSSPHNTPSTPTDAHGFSRPRDKILR